MVLEDADFPSTGNFPPGESAKQQYLTESLVLLHLFQKTRIMVQYDNWLEFFIYFCTLTKHSWSNQGALKYISPPKPEVIL